MYMPLIGGHAVDAGSSSLDDSSHETGTEKNKTGLLGASCRSVEELCSYPFALALLSCSIYEANSLNMEHGQAKTFLSSLNIVFSRKQRGKNAWR